MPTVKTSRQSVFPVSLRVLKFLLKVLGKYVSSSYEFRHTNKTEAEIWNVLWFKNLLIFWKSSYYSCAVMIFHLELEKIFITPVTVEFFSSSPKKCLQNFIEIYSFHVQGRFARNSSRVSVSTFLALFTSTAGVQTYKMQLPHSSNGICKQDLEIYEKIIAEFLECERYSYD